MSTKTTYKIDRPTSSLKPTDVLSQLPSDARSQLGTVTGTGFMLGKDRRDIFCENGTVQYVLNSSEASVEID